MTTTEKREVRAHFQSTPFFKYQTDIIIINNEKWTLSAYLVSVCAGVNVHVLCCSIKIRVFFCVFFKPFVCLSHCWDGMHIDNPFCAAVKTEYSFNKTDHTKPLKCCSGWSKHGQTATEIHTFNRNTIPKSDTVRFVRSARRLTTLFQTKLTVSSPRLMRADRAVTAHSESIGSQQMTFHISLL